MFLKHARRFSSVTKYCVMIEWLVSKGEKYPNLLSGVSWGDGCEAVSRMRRETQILRWKELGEPYPSGLKTPIIEKESHASGMWLPVRTRGNNWEFDVSLPRKISVNLQWSHKTTHKG